MQIPAAAIAQLELRENLGLGKAHKGASNLTPADRLQIVHVQQLGSIGKFVKSGRTTMKRTWCFEKQALIFVHGYNVSFDEAMQRSAQIAFDLQFDGMLVPFSWPSRGTLLGYKQDEKSAHAAADGLVELLDQLTKTMPDTKVHFIAHSMGNIVLMRA